MKSDVTYKLYAITLDGEDKAYVDTLDEAKAKVSELTEKYKKTLKSELGIREVYTDNMFVYKNMKYATVNKLSNSLEPKEQVDIKKTTTDQATTKKSNISTSDDSNNTDAEETSETENTKSSGSSYVNGVEFAKAPVSGRISSRFGVNESVRDHTHTGLDIAASNGTSIYAAADGVVTYAQYNSGGYGNLVKISHGNGVESYYGHCSQLYVTVGQTVKAGDKIAAVGSTGHSTGNHLHFEIRINNTPVNPQKYLY